MAKGYLVPKGPEKYNEARESFYRFLTDNCLDDFKEKDKLFETLVGKLRNVSQDNGRSTTVTFDPAQDLEQTAQWLHDGYTAGSVQGREFDQTTSEFYDLARFRFGRHTKLMQLGLEDNTPQGNVDAKITALFEYAVGTLAGDVESTEKYTDHLSFRKGPGFHFEKGEGRNLAARLKEHYKVEQNGGGPL